MKVDISRVLVLCIAAFLLFGCAGSKTEEEAVKEEETVAGETVEELVAEEAVEEEETVAGETVEELVEEEEETVKE